MSKSETARRPLASSTRAFPRSSATPRWSTGGTHSPRERDPAGLRRWTRRRAGERAPERKHEGASGGDHPGEGAISGKRHRRALELLHCPAAVEAPGMEPKKRSAGASERDEWRRAAWRVMVAQEIDPKRLVFVDETGSNTSLHSLYACSPWGERARRPVPRNRCRNTTPLSQHERRGNEKPKPEPARP